MTEGVGRLEWARKEIACRRELAQTAIPGPWRLGPGGRSGFDLLSDDDGAVLDRGAGQSEDLAFMAANDPPHVLAVLAAADAVLDRHTPRPAAPWPGMCSSCTEPGVGDPDPVPMPWPCPDATAVLDLYAPEVTGG